MGNKWLLQCSSLKVTFLLQKIIAYLWYISNVIVIFYLKLNRLLVNFFFCTLKYCCLAINFEMMNLPIMSNQTRQDFCVVHVVWHIIIYLVRSAVIKFSVLYLIPAVRFLGNKFNFQCCLLVSAINAKKPMPNKTSISSQFK